MIKSDGDISTKVCIIIYNRFSNLEHWLSCWKKCDRGNAELIVIHNTETGEPDQQYSDLCLEYFVRYISRKNIGYDIGCFQDLCRGRLVGFPKDWQRVLWMADDTFPVAYDFVQQFEQAMKQGVGVACMEISPYVTPHIRTSGFMIDRATAERLTFPADPIITKQHCYLFEHRAGKDIFYNQVKKLGLQIVMVADQKTSPLWDIGYHRRLNRKAEHVALFGPYKVADRVLFICPIYKTYPAIISSLIMQTHSNWQLMLIHDGPDTDNVAQWVPDDPRISFVETPKHGGCWGHYIRQVALKEYNSLADFIVVTNPDNYHVPSYLEYMLRGFEDNENAVATYCSHIVHNYIAWKVLTCQLMQGYLDCAGVMIRSWVAKEIPWQDITSHSADWVWFNDILNKFGAKRFQKVEGALLCHN